MATWVTADKPHYEETIKQLADTNHKVNELTVGLERVDELITEKEIIDDIATYTISNGATKDVVWDGTDMYLATTDKSYTDPEQLSVVVYYYESGTRLDTKTYRLSDLPLSYMSGEEGEFGYTAVIPSLNYNTPSTQVLVAMDVGAIQHYYGHSLPSNGIYLGRNSVYINNSGFLTRVDSVTVSDYVKKTIIDNDAIYLKGNRDFTLLSTEVKYKEDKLRNTTGASPVMLICPPKSDSMYVDADDFTPRTGQKVPLRDGAGNISLPDANAIPDAGNSAASVDKVLELSGNCSVGTLLGPKESVEFVNIGKPDSSYGTYTLVGENVEVSYYDGETRYISSKWHQIKVAYCRKSTGATMTVFSHCYIDSDGSFCAVCLPIQSTIWVTNNSSTKDTILVRDKLARYNAELF